jgi:translation initiation factor 2-alpha kinase 4
VNSADKGVDDLGIVRAKLEALFPSSKKRLTAALDNMTTIVNLARACGVSRKILFRPTLSRNAEVRPARPQNRFAVELTTKQFFRGGFMFECVRRGRQRDVIAFGGR